MSDFYGPEDSKALQERLEAEARFSISTTDLSADEQHAVKEKMKAIDELFGGKQLTAKFKVEVQFGKGRSIWKPFPGVISVFLSGSRMHGGGDDKLYLCPRLDCGEIIYPHERVGSKLMCKTCGKMWKQDDVVGELLYFLAPPKWATVIHRMFVKLDHHADIYVKYHPTDIRYQTQMEMARARGGEHINKARAARGLHIYPLKNIIKDTSNGAQLYDRILAFIKA
jgi:hypothetical protein